MTDGGDQAGGAPATPVPARLDSVQVGLPRTRGRAGAADPADRTWTSAIAKEAVSGRVRVHSLGVEGDGQADREHHGGPDKAVLGYAASHYPGWRRELPGVSLAGGAFGENLTLSGLDEGHLAVGDVWSVGSAVLQISQPRQPCWKLARQLRVPDMVERVQRSGRTGWYFRVLEEGDVEAGLRLALEARPHPRWTVARATAVLAGEDAASMVALAALPELSASWRHTLCLRAGGAGVDDAPRVRGPGA